METLNSLLAITAGFLVRLAIPILVTALAVHYLRKLDEQWQAEAESIPLQVLKPECWKINECSPKARKACPGYKSSLPCWQARRLPNGYLREECLGCEVFRMAPVPVHAHAH